MKDVFEALVLFTNYAILAVFAQNAVFTRGLGVSRLVQLVGDSQVSSKLFVLMLCITQVLVAPLAQLAGSLLAPLPGRRRCGRWCSWAVWRWSAWCCGGCWRCCRCRITGR